MHIRGSCCRLIALVIAVSCQFKVFVRPAVFVMDCANEICLGVCFIASKVFDKFARRVIHGDFLIMRDPLTSVRHAFGINWPNPWSWFYSIDPDPPRLGTYPGPETVLIPAHLNIAGIGMYITHKTNGFIASGIKGFMHN